MGCNRIFGRGRAVFRAERLAVCVMVGITVLVLVTSGIDADTDEVVNLVAEELVRREDGAARFVAGCGAVIGCGVTERLMVYL